MIGAATTLERDDAPQFPPHLMANLNVGQFAELASDIYVRSDGVVFINAVDSAHLVRAHSEWIDAAFVLKSAVGKIHQDLQSARFAAGDVDNLLLIHSLGTSFVGTVGDVMRDISTTGFAGVDVQAWMGFAVGKRLAELRALSQDGEEEVNPTSEAGLLRFLKMSGATRPPSIFLVDGGNLRAVWRDADGRQIGLRFLGEDEIQFVIFGRPNPGGQLQRVAQRGTYGDAKGVIADLQVGDLLRQ